MLLNQAGQPISIHMLIKHVGNRNKKASSQLVSNQVSNILSTHIANCQPMNYTVLFNLGGQSPKWVQAAACK